MRATEQYNASNNLTAHASYLSVRGLVISNNSALYILVRAGGNDSPNDAGSADYIVPPFSYFTAPTYNGNFGFRWLTSPSLTPGQLAPGSTRAAGVTTISYSEHPMTYSLSPLPQTTVQSGQFTVVTGTDLNAALGYHTIVTASTGPLYLAYAHVKNGLLIAGTVQVTLLVCDTNTNGDQRILDQVTVDTTASRIPFTASYGPMVTEQAYQIPVGYSLKYQCNGNLQNTNYLANYYQ